MDTYKLHHNMQVILSSVLKTRMFIWDQLPRSPVRYTLVTMMASSGMQQRQTHFTMSCLLSMELL